MKLKNLEIEVYYLRPWSEDQRPVVNLSFNTPEVGFGTFLTIKQAKRLRKQLDEALQEAKQ